MPWLTVRQIGRNGLFPDALPWELPPLYFNDGNNVRTTRGGIGTRLGYEQVATLTGVPRDVSFFGFGTVRESVIATDDALWRYESDGTVSQIPPEGTQPAIVSTEDWDVEALGWGVIACSRANPPFLTALAAGYGELPNWPATWRCSFMREFYGHLFAFDLIEDGADLPHRLRWSNSFAPYAPPDTWIPGPDNNAGFFEFDSRTGRFLDARPLGDRLIVYCEFGAYSIHFRNDDNVFGRRRLNYVSGILNAKAVAQMENYHVIIGERDIFRVDGHGMQSLTFRPDTQTQTVRAQIFTQVTRSKESRKSAFIDYDVALQEIRVFWSDLSTPTLCNRMAAYDTQRGSWTLRDAPNATISGYGPLIDEVIGPTPDGTAAKAWQDASEAWQDAVGPWSFTFGSDPAGRGLLTFATNTIFQENKGNTANGSAFPVLLESPKIDYEQAFGAGTWQQVQQMTIYPQFFGTGQIKIEIGGSDAPNEPVTYNEQWTGSVDTIKRIDFRSTHRYGALKISSSDPSADWVLSGMDVEMVPSGRR